MSSSRMIEVVCPKCTSTQEMHIWDSVNVTLDPDLKEEIMKQRLNVFFCKQCDYRGSVDVSLLYHDMQKRYCIQYVAQDDAKSEEFYRNVSKDGLVILDPISARALGATGGADYMRRPHFVFSMKEVVLFIAFRDLCEAWGR